MVLAALSNRAYGYPGESLVFGRPKTRICTNRCQREPAGCLDWQERGLAPPEAVTAATAAYLEAQDSLAAWLDECCERDANAWERSQTLFAGDEHARYESGALDFGRPCRTYHRRECVCAAPTVPGSSGRLFSNGSMLPTPDIVSTLEGAR
jgi:hypothetical protein